MFFLEYLSFSKSSRLNIEPPYDLRTASAAAISHSEVGPNLGYMSASSSHKAQIFNELPFSTSS